jgi:hypothetical protein
MTGAALLWIVGCCTVAALSVFTIAWLHKQKPPDRVSDRWIGDSLRDRRFE